MTEQKLTDFTFSDTGITVKLQKVSPYLANDIADSNPPPEPPLVEVDYGQPRGKVKEKNWQSPEYIKLVNEHDSKVNDIYNRLLVLRGVVEIEDENWQEKVKEYRKLIKEETGNDVVEKSDKLVYILRIALGTMDDFHDLMKAITRRSYPTAEAVEAAKESFQG